MPERPSHSLVLESLFGEALLKSDIGAFLIQEGRIIAANEAACRLTGYSAEELAALSVTRLGAGPADPERQAAAERGEWLIGDGRLRRKDGETRPVRYVVGRTEVGRAPTYLGLTWEAVEAAAEAAAEQPIAEWLGAPERPAPAEQPQPRRRPDKEGGPGGGERTARTRLRRAATSGS